MGQKKLLRFNQIKSFPNVLEYPGDMKGKWHEFFGNTNDIILELACGRGEYTVGLSAIHPEHNYLGVDVKGNRMYMGAKKCLDENRKNAAFLRTQIEMIGDYFAPGEVSGIWITFPDPQLRSSRAKKRLTHPRFLRLYQQFLKPEGIIHLKTDSPDLFAFTRMIIDLYGLTPVGILEDVYGGGNASAELSIKTHYESLDISGSNKIFYLSFKLPAVIPDKDEELKALLKSLKTEENGPETEIARS
jgi:tRNA (guanine-N7-)-methyltransferase